MSKTNNDNIEDFFRKGLSQQESPFMEEDWKKMEKLLNAHEAGRATASLSNSAKILITSAVVLLLITSTLFVLNNPIRKTSVAEKGLSTENQAALGPKALESKDGNPGAVLISPEDKKSTRKNETSQEIKVENQVNIQQTNKVGSKNNTVLEQNSQIQQAGNVPVKTSIALTSKKIELQENRKSDVVIDDERPVTNTIDVRQDVKSREYETTLQERLTQKDASTMSEAVIASNTGTGNNSVSPDKVNADSVAKENKPAEVNEVKEKSEKDKPLDKVPSRWSVAVVLAPDYSSTEMGNFKSPGKSFGLLIGFNISKRFSVSSGLFRSSKLYTGYGSDYQPPEGYWQRKTNGVVPDEIIGACDVWEIPLMLQYTVVQRPKSRFYAASGMTSYLITHEKYDYCFNNPNPGAASSWSTNKSTTYPFNVGYFAIGYEHRVTNHFAVGIEPFMKVPFKGMGWSHVNIYSTGAYVTARYRFLKKS